MNGFLSKKATTRIIVAALALTLATSGCVKQKTLLKVKSDGSGTIVQSIIVSKGVIDGMKKEAEARAKAAGNNAPQINLLDTMFSDEQLKNIARQFGDGVVFVRSKKIDNATGGGVIAMYSFEDVSKLKFNLKAMTSSQPGMSGANKNNMMTFSLKKGEEPELTINIPQPNKEEMEKIEAVDLNTPSSTPISDDERKQMRQSAKFLGVTGEETSREEVVRKILSKMKSELEIEVDGEVLETNASFPSQKKKNRFTIVSIDFGKLLESNGVCSAFVKNENSSLGIMAVLYSKKPYDGAKIDKHQKISVKFKPKKAK